MSDKLLEIAKRLESVLHPNSRWSYRDDVAWLIEEVHRLRETSAQYVGELHLCEEQFEALRKQQADPRYFPQPPPENH